MRPNEEYLEFLMAPMNDVLGTGVAGGYSAYVQHEVYLPTSENEQLAFILHMVEFHDSHIIPSDAEQVSCHSILTKESHSSQPTVGYNADVIAQYFQGYGCGQDSGALSDYVIPLHRGAVIQWFDPPILIARRVIYHGGRTYNMPIANSVHHLRLGYTLRKVSKDAFIAALVS